MRVPNGKSLGFCLRTGRRRGKRRVKETKLNIRRWIRKTVECSFMIAKGGGYLNKGEGVVASTAVEVGY